MVLAASVAQPVCPIIEDLHWIDFETREVLDRLVDGLPAARVLLLVNYRPESRAGAGPARRRAAVGRPRPPILFAPPPDSWLMRCTCAVTSPTIDAICQTRNAGRQEPDATAGSERDSGKRGLRTSGRGWPRRRRW
jgi:hypothetical protein